MGMIKCPDCGKEISDMAQSCPNCGRPSKGNVQSKESNQNLQYGSAQAQKAKKKGLGCLVTFLFIVFVTILFIVLISTNGTVNNATGTETIEHEYEQIGYAKFKLNSGFVNRSYVYYTTETNEKKLIEHARSLQNTSGGFTYVHYYNDKDKAPDNTLFTEDVAFDLKDFIDGQILVYEKKASGEEVVWDGQMKENKEISVE